MDLFEAPTEGVIRAYLDSLIPSIQHGFSQVQRAVDISIRNDTACVDLSALYGSNLVRAIGRYEIQCRGMYDLERQMLVITGLIFIKLLKDQYIRRFPGHDFQFDVEPYAAVQMDPALREPDEEDSDRRAIGEFIKTTYWFFDDHVGLSELSLQDFQDIVLEPLWMIFEVVKLSADIELLSHEPPVPRLQSSTLLFQRLTTQPPCPN